MMLAIILALALLLAGTDSAHAIFLVPFVVAALGVSPFVAGIIITVGSLALSFGLSYVANKLLAQEQEQPDVGGLELDVRVDADVPQSLIVGRAVTAGSLGYAKTGGQRGDIDNSDLVEIIALADHKCHALVSVFVEGQEVTLQAPGGGDGGQIVDGYDDNLTIKFYDGSQTTADSFLVAYLGTATNQPWTADFIGTEITYVRAHSIFNRDKVQGRMRWRFVLDGIRLYDPRKDTTVGGSGAHRYGTASTHEWTDNPAVIVYNIVRGIYVAGDFFYGIEGTAASQLPLDIWFAAMNECDVLVALDVGGTEKQFRAGAEIFVNTEPREAIQALLKTCGGRFVEIGGIYKLYVGAPGLPVLTFDDGAILATKEDRFKPVLKLEQRINYVTGTYTSPDDGWIPKVAPPRGNDTWRAEDGRRLPADLSVPMVQSGTQMQRLQQQMLNRSRQQRKHTLTLPPAAFHVEPGDVVEWESARNGYTDKLFDVEAVDYENNLCVTLSLTEVDPDDYDWDSDFELPEADGRIITLRPEPKVIVGFDAEAFTWNGDAGTKYPAIRITWDDPEDDDAAKVRWQLRVEADPTNETTGSTDDVTAEQVVIAGGLQPSTAYEVRARFESFNGYLAEWSLWIPVTTLSEHLVGGVRPGGLDIASFAAGIEPVAIVSSLPNPVGYTGPAVVFLTTDEQLYRYAGGAWVAAIDGVSDFSELTGQVVTAQIAAAAVTAAKLAAAAVDATKLASSISAVEIFDTLPVTGNFEGRAVYLTTDDKLYRYNGTGFSPNVAAGDVTGQLTDAQIAALAATKITGQLTDAQIAALAATKITGQLTDAQIAALAAAKLTGQITTTQISDGGITTPKIATGAVVTASLAASAVTSSKIVVGSYFENLVPNGGFEDGIVNWTNLTTGGSIAASGASHSGSGALQASRPSTAVDLACISVNFPVEEGQAYEFTAWTAPAGVDHIYGAAVLYLGVNWKNNVGTNIAGATIGPVAIPSGWTKNAGQLISPANAKFADVFIYLPAAAGATTGLLEVDDVSCRKAGGTTYIEDGAVVTNKIAANAVTAGTIAAGAITTAKLVAGAVTANEIAANAVTAVAIAAGAITTAKISAGAVTANEISAGAITTPKLAAGAVTANEIAANTITAGKIAAAAIGTTQLAAGAVTTDILAAGAVVAGKMAISSYFENLVPNGGFEDGIVGWTNLSTGGSIVASAANHSGSGALQASRPSTAVDLACVSNNFPVEEGQAYEFTAWTAPANLDHVYGAPVLYLGVNWKDASGAGLAAPLIGPIAIPSGWTKNVGQLTSPANAKFANVFIYLPVASGATTGIIEVDDVSCRKAGGTTYIEDGAITTNKIVADAITAVKIAADAVTAAKISAGAITTVKLAAGAVTANELAANSVIAGKIAAAAISATEIATGAIVAGKIAAGAINTGSLVVDNLVVTGHIVANAVTNHKIANASDLLVIDVFATSQTVFDTSIDVVHPSGETFNVYLSVVVNFGANNGGFGGTGMRGSWFLFIDDLGTYVSLGGWAVPLEEFEGTLVMAGVRQMTGTGTTQTISLRARVDAGEIPTGHQTGFSGRVLYALANKR